MLRELLQLLLITLDPVAFAFGLAEISKSDKISLLTIFREVKFGV